MLHSRKRGAPLNHGLRIYRSVHFHTHHSHTSIHDRLPRSALALAFSPFLTLSSRFPKKKGKFFSHCQIRRISSGWRRTPSCMRVHRNNMFSPDKSILTLLFLRPHPFYRSDPWLLPRDDTKYYFKRLLDKRIGKKKGTEIKKKNHLCNTKGHIVSIIYLPHAKRAS